MPKAVKGNAKEEEKAMACQLCLRDDEDEMRLGKLHSLGNISAHYYCLLFSSALPQSGKRDDQGILRFMPKDITAEIRRGRRLRCCYCKLNGATLGCVFKKCPRAYHLPCGLEHNIMMQFFGTFPTYCKDHRFYQDDIPWPEKKTLCSICWEDLVPKVSADTLYPPCCKNGWFHKTCVQKQAFRAGYFFRCPLCNNQTEFNEEMEKFGVHVPEQDAAWECEPGAFSEMYNQYSHCDVPKCVCPHGRNYDEDTIAESIWELVRCGTCGSQGTHIGCSNLNLACPEWTCSNCLPAVDRLENTARKNLHLSRKDGPRARQKSSQRVLRQRGQVTSYTDSSSRSLDANTNVTGISGFSESDVLQSKNIQQKSVKPFYRQRHDSASSSNSDVFLENEMTASSHPPQANSESDSDDSSGSIKKRQISPLFSLKRPASFRATSDQDVSLHPVKKMYLTQTSGNPFAGSSGGDSLKPNMLLSPNLPTELHLEEQKCSKTAPGNREDHVNLAGASPNIATDTDSVITVSDSDDHDEENVKSVIKSVSSSSVSESNGELVLNCGTNFSRAPNINIRNSKRACSVSRRNKEVLFEKGNCISDKSITSRQLSILKFLPKNSKLPLTILPSKKKHKKTIAMSQTTSLKITAFYQPQSKNMPVINSMQVRLKNVDDENTAPVP